MFSSLSSTNSYQIMKLNTISSPTPLYYYTFNTSTINNLVVNTAVGSTNNHYLNLNSTSGISATIFKEGDKAFTNGNRLYYAENINGMNIPTAQGITICFWFYILTGNGTVNQLCFSTGIGTTSKIYFFLSPSSNQIVLSIQNGSNNIFLETLTTSVWKHFAFSYTGTTLKCYINGVLKTFTATSVPSLTNETWTSCSVGRDVSGGASGNIYGPGYCNIDCVRIYNQVLTQSQIQSIYNAGN